MSSGSATIPLLKAAPEAGQVADRLAGGDWRGLELCLAPGHVATREALDRAIAVGRDAADRGLALTAECPVAWPSGAFVRVERRGGLDVAGSQAQLEPSPVAAIEPVGDLVGLRSGLEQRDGGGATRHRR